MFPNAITVTVNALAKNLVRINQDKYSSEYILKETTQGFRLTIQHQRGSVKRNSVISVTNPQYTIERPIDRIRVYISQTVYATASTPEYKYECATSFPFVDGQLLADTRNLTLGLQGLMNSAFLDQLIQGES